MTDTDPPDLQTLARRYLDLWQEQLGAMARDPAVSEALAQSFSLMTQGLADAARDPAKTAGAAGATPDAAPDGGEHGRPDPAAAAGTSASAGGYRAGAAAAAAGAAPAGAASGRPGPADDDLAARLERLEQRVALLEAALGGLLSGANRPGGA